MQLQKATARVLQSRPKNKEQWLSLLDTEYEQLVKTLSDWSHCRQQWVELKTQNFKRRWDETEIHRQLMELESALNSQRRQWRMLTQQFA